VCDPQAVSATALGTEVGVAQATLSRWPLRAGTVGLVRKPGDKAKSRTVEDKMRLVLETSQFEGDKLGAFLRREGIHEAEFAEWQRAVSEALGGTGPRPAERARSEDKRRLQKLEREIARKD
jgi:transposase